MLNDVILCSFIQYVTAIVCEAPSVIARAFMLSNPNTSYFINHVSSSSNAKLYCEDHNPKFRLVALCSLALQASGFASSWETRI